ncbi:MAG: DEAD/DEAH box helicase [Treponema bryantii]|nr:DEAD/DEAH box helicase [Treponema bryantii]
MGNTNVFLSLSENLNEKLSSLNIKEPTAVQKEIIPLISQGEDVVFQSETGTGKTFAYLLPLINKLEQENDSTKLRILVVAPTFELASQINMNVKSITNRKSALIIGGAPIKRQLETLKEKPQIICGSVARIVELIRLKKIKINDLFAIVFDETDRLVKKELLEETNELYNLIPQSTQIIACTATINQFTKRFFAGINNVILPNEDILTKRITHWAIYAEQRDKIETLRKFLLAEKPSKVLIFTSRADQVENITSKLKYKNFECASIHAKSDKQERKATLDRFRSGKNKILITSDLAARGLDIPNITHIVQMDLPSDEDFFIHRSGRTARAGKTGINVVIGDEFEMNQFAKLEKKLKITVYPKEIYGGKVLAPRMD